MPPLSPTVLETVPEDGWKVSADAPNTEPTEVDDDHAEDDPNSRSIVWRNVFAFTVMNLCIPHSFYILYRDRLWGLFMFNMFVGYMSGLGVTAGAHRLWAHRTYKARLPLRIFLAFWFTISGQGNIYVWSRDHRVHHKFTETDADPHNAHRGFFFAHMGWLCLRKHRDVFTKGSTVDVSDLLDDPVVYYQEKYYGLLWLLFNIFLPVSLNHYLFGISWAFAMSASLTRFALSLHVTWLVNSAAHFFGSQPYNESIAARESPLVIVSNMLGEGYHNYHHQFPQDYKASEYGWICQFNLTAAFIDLMAAIGQAYDRRSPSKEVVEKCKQRVAMHQKHK